MAAAREFLRQSTLPAKPEVPVAESKPGDKKDAKKVPKALTPWEQYAQVLLAANEFAFID